MAEELLLNPQQYNSVVFEETAKGIRIRLHVYAVIGGREELVTESVRLYEMMRTELERKGHLLAPMKEDLLNKESQK